MPSIRAKQYQRVVTHLDVWSATKLAFLFYVVVALMWIAAGVILWNVMAAFGWIEKIESLIGNLATGSFRLHSGAVLRAGLIIAGVFTLGMTLLTMLLVLIYNLISDVVGGLGFRVEDRGTRQPRVMSFGRFKSTKKKPAPTPANGRRREAKPAASTARRRPAAAQKPTEKAGQTKTAAAARTAKSGQSGGPRARPAASGAKPKPSSGTARKPASGQSASKATKRSSNPSRGTSGAQSETRKRRDSSSVAPLPRETARDDAN